MDLTGRSLKQYQLVGELGAGGMGVVYRARDTVLGRDAAIKVLPADKLQREQSRRRFLREARAASALNHPNVITIYEIGCVDGIDFIAMEYVSGHTLQALLRQRRLTVAEAAGYAHQTADALAKAHAAGVVHRDIKPSNLMISNDGLVKVLDFGLARLNEATEQLDDNAPTNMAFVTRPGTVLGTVAYMSPEQARGEEAGPASDIFSLGVMLFEMLAGELPFSGDSDIARLHSLHFTPPKDLRVLSPELPEGLIQLVACMLEKDLGARCPSMADVRRELRPFAGLGSTLAEIGAMPSQSEARPGITSAVRRRMNWTVAAAVVAVLVLGGAFAAGRFALSSFTDARASVSATLPASAFDPATAKPYDLYIRARALLDRFDREDNPSLAIDLLERAIEKDHTFALGHATLTEAYRYRFKLAPDEQWRNLMSQSAQRAVKLDPELGAAHIAMGLVLMESGELAEAESRFRRASELDPRNPAPHMWMAVLLSPSGQTDRAVESLTNALTIDPDNWAALQELGLIQYRAADYSQAVAAWEQARKASPDNARVLANLSAGYHMLDRYEDAASTLQRAIEIEPAPRHYANLGTLRFFQGRYDDAIPPLEKAVELIPNRYRYWGNLADAYRWSTGHKARARETYARAIQLLREQLAQKPADLDMRSTLALYLAKSGDAAGAAGELSQFEGQSPSQAAVLFRLAVAHEITGNRDKALGALDNALKAGYAMKEIRSEPELVGLRSDIRYHKMAASLPAPSSR
jgi:eukaryotic-like serine/threonine-protein kinase